MTINNKTCYRFTFNNIDGEQLIFFTDFIESDDNKKLYFNLKTLKSIFKLSTLEILTSLDCKYDDGNLSSKELIVVEVKNVLKLCDKYLDRKNVRSFRDFIIETILPSDKKIANAYKHYIEEYNEGIKDFTDLVIRYDELFKILCNDKTVMNKDFNKNEKLFSIKEACNIINNKLNKKMGYLDIYYLMKVSRMINSNTQSLSISLTEKSIKLNLSKIIIHNNDDIGCCGIKELVITPDGLDYLINFCNNHLRSFKKWEILI